MLAELDGHERVLRRARKELSDETFTAQVKQAVSRHLSGQDLSKEVANAIELTLAEQAERDGVPTLLLAVRTVRKLRAVAEAGILRKSDPELRYIRVLTAAIVRRIIAPQ